jgi:multiple antibiotic resistance protein
LLNLRYNETEVKAEMSIVFAILKATVALFIIIDPIGLIPVFMSLTHDLTGEVRTSIFRRAFFVAFVFLLLFALAGTGILTLFGITINDFKIAGGILLLIIALRIINEAHYGQETGRAIGVVPLAVPLLAGPGAITTTIVLLGSYGLWITLAGLVISFALTYLIFRFVNLFFRLIGKTGADVVAKIMGMLLAAIAIQFIRQGLEAVFHI